MRRRFPRHPLPDAPMTLRCPTESTSDRTSRSSSVPAVPRAARRARRGSRCGVRRTVRHDVRTAAAQRHSTRTIPRCSSRTLRTRLVAGEEMTQPTPAASGPHRRLPRGTDKSPRLQLHPLVCTCERPAAGAFLPPIGRPSFSRRSARQDGWPRRAGAGAEFADFLDACSPANRYEPLLAPTA